MAEVKEKKPHYLGHRKRLRERFLKSGGKGMEDYEILEMLLFASKPRSDVKPLAKELVSKFGNMAAVLSAPPNELGNLGGMSDGAIASLKVAREAAVRMLAADIEDKPILQSWKNVLEYCRASMSFNKTEQFRIFFLDKKNKLIADELQQEGTVDHTPIYPREVVKRALELGASSIILVHNHPSGDPTPSKADVKMTEQIVMAAASLGVEVHDHLIVAGKKHYSFTSHGLI